VWAVSGQGVGIHAKGGQLAGYFDGPVEITGNLTIQGVSIQTWLQGCAFLKGVILCLV